MGLSKHLSLLREEVEHSKRYSERSRRKGCENKEIMKIMEKIFSFEVACWE